MRKLWTPFRVGLLVLVSGACLIAGLAFVKKGGLSKSETVELHAFFHDASGLGKKSRVQVAGILVGDIEDIQLDGTRAKITLRIRKDVGVRANATLTKRSESLLGDYMIDLFPGDETAPPLRDGDEIKGVVDAQGMEQLMGSMSQITGDVREVTKALRDVLGGSQGEGSMREIVQNLVELTKTVKDTGDESSERLRTILQNIDVVTHEVRGITEGKEDSVKRIVENIEGITRDVRDVMGQVKGIVGNNEGDLKDSVSSLKETLGRLDHSLQNIEEVTEKVKSGEGTLGKLVSDDRMGQKLSETVEDASDFVSRLTNLQTEVSVTSDYLIDQGSSKNTVGIRLIPKPDKYYLLEFVDDPRGSVSTQTIQTNPPSAGQPVTQVQTITSDSLKISAEFAKRFYFATLRFGLIESTGGVGADLNFFSDKLQLKLDAFNFSVEELRYPRVRATVKFSFFEHLFVNAGVDDIFNQQVRDTRTNKLIAGRDYFVGAGIFFTDDDLKALLTVAPIPKP